MKKLRFAHIWVALLMVGPGLLLGPAFIAHTRQVRYLMTDAHAKTADGSYTVVKDRNPLMQAWPVQKLTKLPSAPTTPGSPFAVDLSWKDVSALDLSQAGDLLTQYASFGTETLWPPQLPAGFDPDKFMELGKDPGLGIRALHSQGITGKGVKVALLDQTLLRSHQEYKTQIQDYTEVGLVAPRAEIHGAAAASILAGKSIGVAPDATVEYYATEFVKDYNTLPSNWTFLPTAQVINQILDQNKQLPLQERVRVISISNGVDNPDKEGYAEVQKAYQRAIQEGVLVVSGDMDHHYPYGFVELGRQPDLDPNDPRSYTPSKLWANAFFAGQGYAANRKAIYVPGDSRTVASPTYNAGYTFYRFGGISWTEPYAAGVYALALQVNVNLTPEQFLAAAYETGDYTTVTHDGKEFKLGPILNPQALLAKVKP